MALLSRAWKNEPVQLIIVYRRCRIGKTSPLSEFSPSRRAFQFAATSFPEAPQVRELGAEFGAALDDKFPVKRQSFAYIEDLPERIGLIFEEFPQPRYVTFSSSGFTDARLRTSTTAKTSPWFTVKKY